MVDMTDPVKQTATRVVYKNKWMRVREDEVVRDDGSHGIFGVVEKRDFALIIPAEDDAVWLVEQFRYPVAGRFWEFPQGSWENQAAEPAELARAELAEEPGLRAATLQHLGHLYEAYGYSDQGFDVFLATHLTPGAPTHSVEEQDMASRRVTTSEFEEMVARGEIKDAPSVAAYGLWLLARPRSTTWSWRRMPLRRRSMPSG